MKTNPAVTAARRWLAQDPDPHTRTELEELLRTGDETSLHRRFSEPMVFGTAGLRGPLGAGPSHMNRVTVMQATHGWLTWAHAQIPRARERGICVARDARKNSDLFARDVIAIALGMGFAVHHFTEPEPTPLLAFSVLHLGAAGGVVITASHNPPEYNGFKIYWHNGAQIIPPHDEQIASLMAVCPPVNGLSRGCPSRAQPFSDAVKEAYLRTVHAAIPPAPEDERPPLEVAHTAMHGVGHALLQRALEPWPEITVHPVHEQSSPDGNFPTVSFPNPEEPGAMDLVLELARERTCDLAFAHDPDADRLAVAVADLDGQLTTLSGNDLGCLLADFLLTHNRRERPLVLSTVVSSPLLGRIAHKHNARWEPTLTGFKWIMNRAQQLAAEGYHPVFAYEEAIGYGPVMSVQDKDGISAALMTLRMAQSYRAEGRTLIQARDDLFDELGRYTSLVHAHRVPGPGPRQAMRRCLDAIREGALRGLPALGEHRLEDLTVAPPDDPGRPTTDLLIMHMGSHRLLVRPSGTEPKLKIYLDYFGEPGPASALLEAAKSAILPLCDSPA